MEKITDWRVCGLLMLVTSACSLPPPAAKDKSRTSAFMQMPQTTWAPGIWAEVVHNLWSNVGSNYNYTHMHINIHFSQSPLSQSFTGYGMYLRCGVGESFILPCSFWWVCVCWWEWSFTFVIASVAIYCWFVFAHLCLVCCVAWRPSHRLSQCIVWQPRPLYCVIWWCPGVRKVLVNTCYCL